MAEVHKFSDLGKALEVFPELTWAQDGDGNTYVDNSKTGERVPVAKGQHIVKIADRYEVHDDAPENAKKATKAEPQPDGSEQSNPQVAPEAVGAPADSQPAMPADQADAAAAPAAE